jgi:head-tail adaptor
MRRAGERRHYVELQSITGRTASGDGYVNVWTTYDWVWASVEAAPAGAVDRPSGGTQETPVTHRVELDFRTDLAPEHRVRKDGAQLLFIRGMENEQGRDKTYVLSCEERRQ